MQEAKKYETQLETDKKLIEKKIQEAVAKTK